MQTLQDRLAVIIAEQGINQSELAKSLTISPASVSSWFSGKTKPSSQSIDQICSKFGYNPGWLRTGEGEKSEPLTKEEEIAELVGRALNGSSDFKKAVVKMICSRTDSELQALEAALRNIYENL